MWEVIFWGTLKGQGSGLTTEHMKLFFYTRKKTVKKKSVKYTPKQTGEKIDFYSKNMLKW